MGRKICGVCKRHFAEQGRRYVIDVCPTCAEMRPPHGDADRLGKLEAVAELARELVDSSPVVWEAKGYWERQVDKHIWADLEKALAALEGES